MGKATVYYKEGFDGRSAELEFGDYDEDDLRRLNIDKDTISSLKVDDDAKITLYGQEHFRRPMATYYEDEKDLGSIHNRTESIRVERRV